VYYILEDKYSRINLGPLLGIEVEEVIGCFLNAPCPRKYANVAAALLNPPPNLLPDKVPVLVVLLGVVPNRLIPDWSACV